MVFRSNFNYIHKNHLLNATFHQRHDLFINRIQEQYGCMYLRILFHLIFCILSYLIFCIKYFCQQLTKRSIIYSFSYPISLAYILEYEMTKPTRPKVSLSFYETQLDQFDVQKLETEAIDDESYRPIPQFYSYGLHKAPVLEYDPAKYSIRFVLLLKCGYLLSCVHLY